MAAAAASLLDRRFSAFTKTLLQAAGSATVSALIAKAVIKPLFGRPFPHAYVYGMHGHFGWHTSLLPQQSAFPSTHAALTAAMACVFAASFPRWGGLCILVVTIIDLLLVAGGWHFVSDVIAGNLLGFSLAMISLSLAAMVNSNAGRG